MINREENKINQYLKIILEFYKDHELDTANEDIFSCDQCPLRPTCTGHVSHTMITRLNNSIEYELSYAFIIHHTPIMYQLKVIHLNVLLLDECCQDLESAKQSFLLHFSHQAAVKDLHPYWTSYFPCSDWLEEMMTLKPVEIFH